jgi:hypothetical protein
MTVRGTENFEGVLPGKAGCFSKRRVVGSVSDVERSTDWLVRIKPIKTYGWEYQVEVWGWPLPVDRRIRASLLGKVHYYRRILERILNKNAWTIGQGLQGSKASKELIKAVEELPGPREVNALTLGKLEERKNQNSELERSEECNGNTGGIVNKDPNPTETNKVINDQAEEDRENAKELKSNGENQIVPAETIGSQTVSNNRSIETEWLARKPQPRTEFDEASSTTELLVLWMKYVYYTRTQEGLNDQLPKLGRRRCLCGKSQMSFPHWPPTSQNEAEVQLQMCFEERNSHRKYLAHCWWSFINDIANMEPWIGREPQQRYKDGREEILRRCPAVAEEQRMVTRLPRRPRGWRCNNYCEVTLKERRCSCLCHCKQHRDQCPTDMDKHTLVSIQFL